MIVLSREVGHRIRVELAGHGQVIVTIRRIVGDRIEFELDVPRTIFVCRGEMRQASRHEDDSEN